MLILKWAFIANSVFSFSLRIHRHFFFFIKKTSFQIYCNSPTKLPIMCPKTDFWDFRCIIIVVFETTTKRLREAQKRLFEHLFLPFEGKNKWVFWKTTKISEKIPQLKMDTRFFDTFCSKRTQNETQKNTMKIHVWRKIYTFFCTA